MVCPWQAPLTAHLAPIPHPTNHTPVQAGLPCPPSARMDQVMSELITLSSVLASPETMADR